MRWKTLALFACVLVVSMLTGTAQAEETAANPLSLSPQPAMSSLEAPAECAPRVEEAELFGIPEPDLACGSCPNRCSSDAQCFAQCGNVAGSCARINSCCRACLCSA